MIENQDALESAIHSLENRLGSAANQGTLRGIIHSTLTYLYVVRAERERVQQFPLDHLSEGSY